MSIVSSSQRPLTRISVKCIVNGDCFTHSGSFDATHVSTYLSNLLNIDVSKAIKMSYKIKNSETLQEIFTNYVFIDFDWNSNESNRFVLEQKSLLLEGQPVLINISQNESWIVSLQDKSINVMKNSQSSSLMYFINENDIIPEDKEEYSNWVAKTILNEPFDAMEEPPSMGYRDEYVYFFGKITKNSQKNAIEERMRMEEDEQEMEVEMEVEMEEEMEREERYETQLERFKDDALRYDRS